MGYYPVEVVFMNRRRFQSDMEAAWELRPSTDETPGSSAHLNRFTVPRSMCASRTAVDGAVEQLEKSSPAKKNGENGR